MEIFKQLFLSPFVWGLLLGLLITVFSVWSHLRTRREFKRYQRHLSDKMEIEAKAYQAMKDESAELQKSNERLRLQVGTLSEKPEQRVMRELEVLARAEKRMMVQAPGFAPAWEIAKQEAIEELEAEEQGKSLPKRIFRKIFGGKAGSGEVVDALPAPAEGSEEEEEAIVEGEENQKEPV